MFSYYFNLGVRSLRRNPALTALMVLTLAIGVAVRTPIQLGATSISAVEVLSGLKPGDKVVISGTDTFNNAQRVSINR